MNFIKNIISFFKRLFNKDSNIKMIEAPIEMVENNEKTKFIDSLKVNITKNFKKNKVETLTCFGDGLGIQDKISY